MALSLGKTYQELVDGIPGLGSIDGIPELYWWMAFDRIWPFGRSELLLAQMATILHNANISEPKYRASLYDYWREKRPLPTAREKENVLRMALGLTPKRPDEK